MLYSFNRQYGVELSSVVVSNELEVIDPLNAGQVNLTISQGSIVVNGLSRGNTADVTASDKIAIEITSASTYVTTTFVEVYQDGDLASIFVVTTTFDPDVEFNSEYLNVEPYDILETSEWVPIAQPHYELYPQGTTLPIADESGDFTLSRLVACDFHRDLLYFIDPLNGLAKTVSNELTKPASSVDLYTAGGFRLAHIVLYRGQDTLAFFEDYTRDPANDFVLDASAKRIKIDGFTLYVLFEDNTLKTFNVDETFSITEGSIVDTDVLDFALDSGNVAYVKGTTTREFIDFDGTSYPVNDTADMLAYNPTLDHFVVGHRATGFITYIDGILGNRQKTYSGSAFIYLTEIEAYQDKFVAVGEFYGISIFDKNTSKFFAREVPSFGIQNFTNFLAITHLYPDAEARVNSVDLRPNTLEFNPEYFVLPGGQIFSETQTVNGLEQAATLAIPNLSNPEVALIVNGTEIAGKTAVVDNGDTFAIVVRPVEIENSRLDIPVVVGSSIFTFSVLPIPGSILPHRTGFGPIYGEPNTQGYSEERSFPFLREDDSIFVEVDVGSIFINRINMGKSANVKAFDKVSFSHTIPSTRCGVNYQTVTYGSGMFSTVNAYKQTGETDFTLVGLGEPNTNVEDVWNLQPLQTTLRTADSIVRCGGSRVTLEIPDSFSARLFKNNVDVGLRSTFNDGDLLSVEMTTSAHYNIEHQLTISSCGMARLWEVFTAPDLFIDAFDLGTQEDLAITDYVVSEEMTVTGLGYRQVADVVVPYGTSIFINGIKQYFDNKLLDYRGMLKEDFVLKGVAKEGTRIRLEGYPRGTYGSTQKIPLKVGFTTGYWTLKTYYVDPKAPVMDSAPALVSDRAETEISYYKAVLISDKVSEGKMVVGASAVFGTTQPVPEIFFNGEYESNTVAEYLTATAEPTVVSSDSFITEASGISVVSDQKFITTQAPLHTSTEIVAEGWPNSVQEFDGLTAEGVNTVDTHLFSSGDWIAVFDDTIVEYGLPKASYTPVVEHLSSFAAPEHFTYTEVLSGPMYAAHFSWEMYEFDFSEIRMYDFDVEPSLQFATASLESIADAVYFEAAGEASFSIEFDEHRSPITFYFDFDFSYNDKPEPFYEFSPSWQQSHPEPFYTIYGIWKTFSNEPFYRVHQLWEKFVRPEYTTTPSWIVALNQPTWSIASSWHVEDSNDLVLVANNAEAESSHDQFFIQANPYSAETSSFVTVDSSYYDVPVNGNYTFAVLHDIAEDEVNVLPLQQVFDSELEALANANSYGLVPPEIVVVPYEDKFIWVHSMPCENMCYACPATGYIHGG